MHPSVNLPRPPATLTATRPRVLLVDDEENILASLRRLLHQQPYEVLTARTAQDALRMLEERPVELIVTDYRMPGMSGTDLLRQVQQRWPDTVRIVLSGYSEVKSIIAAINEGAIYKFVTKPWNDEEMKLHVRRAMEQALLAAENRAMASEIASQNAKLRELNRRLDQRASDATHGLTCAQELVEARDVGVLVIDETGLIVSANRRAAKLLARPQAALLGVSATGALPPAMRAALVEWTRGTGVPAGHLVQGERRLQWRAQSLDAAGLSSATAVAIWEEVACPPA